MSSIEWSRYMHDVLGVPVDPERISSDVADRLVELYRKRLPLLPGAAAAVDRSAPSGRSGLASSSNRNVIDLVLDLAGIADEFAATVSSEEVQRGKPAPDVYLEAARRLGVDPAACAAVEDSTNGIRSAHAAGMAVIAIPNQDFPPEREALDLAALVLDSLQELSLEQVRSLRCRLTSYVRPTIPLANVRASISCIGDRSSRRSKSGLPSPSTTGTTVTSTRSSSP